MLAVCLGTDIRILAGTSSSRGLDALQHIIAAGKKKAGLFKARPFSVLKTPVSGSILRSAGSKKQQKKRKGVNLRREAESRAQRRPSRGTRLTGHPGLFAVP